MSENKIVFFIPGLNKGGAERVASYVANYFNENKYIVNILTMNESSIAYKINEGIKIQHLMDQSQKSKISIILHLRKYLNAIKPMVVFCFSMKLAIYCRISSIGRKIKIIASERSNPNYAYHNKFNNLFYRFIFRHIHGFVFLNNQSRLFYKHIEDCKIKIIPNGVFLDNINDNYIEYKSRNLSKIVAVGRLSEVKNYKTMLLIFSKFLSQNNHYELHIIGEGELRDELMRIANEYGIADKVKFIGLVEDIGSELKNACMFIHTSVSESWGNAIMEAMAFGIPCVVMDCDYGPRNFIENGVNGILVKQNDIDAFVEAMKNVTSSLEYASILSRNAFQVNSTYNHSRISDLYMQYCESVINEK